MIFFYENDFLYMYYFDFYVNNVFTKLFIRNNYNYWKIFIEVLLVAKNEFDFVRGKVVRIDVNVL